MANGWIRHSSSRRGCRRERRGGCLATVAGAAAEGAYEFVASRRRSGADLDASSRDGVAPRIVAVFKTNRRARGRWFDARRLVSADTLGISPGGERTRVGPLGTLGWLVAKSRDAVRADADGTKSLVCVVVASAPARAEGWSLAFPRGYPSDEMIPGEGQTTSSSRAPDVVLAGGNLWKKVRDNRMLLIGEGLGTGVVELLAQARGGDGVSVQVIQDINGKRKTKVRRCSTLPAAKLKKSTKFPRSEAFDRELAELELTPHQIHRLCKEQRMKIRDGPNPIKPVLLKVSSLHPMHGKYGNDLEPTPLGRNWLGYWMPLVLALVQCFMISFVTVGVTYAAYTLGEHWHHAIDATKSGTG